MGKDEVLEGPANEQRVVAGRRRLGDGVERVAVAHDQAVQAHLGRGQVAPARGPRAARGRRGSRLWAPKLDLGRRCHSLSNSFSASLRTRIK